MANTLYYRELSAEDKEKFLRYAVISCDLRCGARLTAIRNLIKTASVTSAVYRGALQNAYDLWVDMSGDHDSNEHTFNCAITLIVSSFLGDNSAKSHLKSKLLESDVACIDIRAIVKFADYEDCTDLLAALLRDGKLMNSIKELAKKYRDANVATIDEQNAVEDAVFQKKIKR